MYILKNPVWLKKHDYPYKRPNEIPVAVFNAINERLAHIQSDHPIVSIVIIAWNEELNILNCVSSLSYMKTKFPFEIIVVNNNSSDGTQGTLDNLKVRGFLQKIQGCGPARQMGQENAKGKYILLADADCVYPETWIDAMLEELKKPKVVCVYGRYSFIGEKEYPRWKLSVYELFKDAIAELRHLKRPYLNAFGMSMGYIRELGLQVGYVNHNIRGEDGRLCFDLMKYGKVKQVKSNRSRVWTKPRTLQMEGGFYKVLYNRMKIEFGRFSSLFFPHPPHDTKISRND